MHSGAEVSAHFDSLLVKLTCRGRDWSQAVARARRALAEFRIRGVATNIPFLQAVLEDPDFAAGGVTTSFIETHPQLLTARHSADRGTRLLTYLADVTVNRPYGARPPALIEPHPKLPRGRPRATRRRTAPGSCWPSSARTGSRGWLRDGTRPARSPTPRSATPTSRCWPPGCAPATWP